MTALQTGVVQRNGEAPKLFQASEGNCSSPQGRKGGILHTHGPS